MVKAVYFGPSFSEKLTQFCNKGTSTGLILGSVVDERAFGVCCVETPAEVEVEENNSELVKKDVAVDVTWMLEHATQVNLKNGQLKQNEQNKEFFMFALLAALHPNKSDSLQWVGW